MRQLFFISLGLTTVADALRGIGGVAFHAWLADGVGVPAIGVVEMSGQCDGEAVATALEAASVLVLPHPLMGGQITAQHYNLLKRHGVSPTDTTAQAMTKVHAVSGFHPLKPKRF